MFKNKHVKIIISAFLVLMALWVATPRVYIHNLLHHNHTETGLVPGAETNVKATGDDCDFEKYDKPVYFSIFKFIFSFIPVKSQDEDKVATTSGKLTALSSAIQHLRAPPVSQ